MSVALDLAEDNTTVKIVNVYMLKESDSFFFGSYISHIVFISNV